MTALHAPAMPGSPGPPPRNRHLRWWVLAGIVLVLAATVTTVVTVATTGPHHAQRSPWRLVWHDEFDGSALSPARWNVRDGATASNEESIVTARPSNVHVADGALVITARRERYTAGSTTRDYTSGYLDTIGRGSWRYGRFVMRAKLPESVGLWPAFWLRADHGKGEVDVLEAVGGDPRRTVQTVHRSTDGGEGKVGHVDHLVSGTTAQWHTYALDLRPAHLTWSIDGRTVFEVGPRQAPWLAQTFDEPVNIRLNLQVGGSMPRYFGSPVTAATAFPARFEVDWVRVYQYN